MAKYMLYKLVISCTGLIKLFLVSPSVVVQPQLIGIPVGKILLIYYRLDKNLMSHLSKWIHQVNLTDGYN